MARAIDALGYAFTALLFVGGSLALSNLIAAKRPEAKWLLDRLVRYQALVGVALLGIGIALLVHTGPIAMFRGFERAVLSKLALIGGVFSGIALGFFFGMPQIAAWIPGESRAEARAVALSRKLAPYTVLVGIAALGSGALLVLGYLGLLKYL